MYLKNDQRYYYGIISMLYFSSASTYTKWNYRSDKTYYLLALDTFFNHCYFWTVGNELVKNIKALKWKIQQSTKLPIFNFSRYNGNWLDKIVLEFSIF